MTLQEAMASGKLFKRSFMNDYYDSVADMLSQETSSANEESEALRANDYVLESTELDGVTEEMLVAAWNSARGTSTTIAVAATSTFFARFKAKLVDLVNEG